jgi:hypothetical protein
MGRLLRLVVRLGFVAGIGYAVKRYLEGQARQPADDRPGWNPIEPAARSVEDRPATDAPAKKAAAKKAVAKKAPAKKAVAKKAVAKKAVAKKAAPRPMQPPEDTAP